MRTLRRQKRKLHPHAGKRPLRGPHKARQRFLARLLSAGYQLGWTKAAGWYLVPPASNPRGITTDAPALDLGWDSFYSRGAEAVWLNVLADVGAGSPKKHLVTFESTPRGESVLGNLAAAEDPDP